ncbi:hypothetical protein [Shimia haliotis]|uniref:PfkB family carbohydrate kinase n=1 Tax=Shimia haliotis TaxID=1280847 RepID=A0A1I4H183_9RHOB|nr:pfkB family carbohydrate kinase [Shimia haliotis]
MIPASTVSGAVVFEQLSEGQAAYTYIDEKSAGRMLQAHEFPHLTQEVSALYFGGGSLACVPGADAYATFAQQNAEGGVFMLDPNIRAGFVRDEARFRARLDTMVSGADIFKVSDEDLDWVFPDDDPFEKSRPFVRAGASRCYPDQLQLGRERLSGLR